MPLKPAQVASIPWSQLLRVDTGANEFEHNLHHAWAQLGARPSVVRHGFAVPASKFWAYLNAAFALTEEHITESADHGVDEDEDFVHNRYYMLHIADGIFLSCTEFTPEYDLDEHDNDDMVERHVGDICLFYKYSKELFGEVEEVTAQLKAFKAEGHGSAPFYTLHPALGGYTIRHASLPDDDIDIVSHFGEKVAKKLAKAVSGQQHVVVAGEADFGGDILLREAIRQAATSGSPVIYLPEFLYPHLPDGTAEANALLDAIQELAPCYVVLENAHNMSEPAARALALLSEAYDLRYLATSEDAKIQLGNKADTCRIATGKVDAETANALAAEVGLTTNFTEPTTLADVYATSRPAPRRRGRVGLSDRHL
jgi:hypothetical protein